MNPSESPEVSVKILFALRKENEAVRLITERLKVKEIGPADHIRTKHEVKAFVEAGDAAMADALVQRAPRAPHRQSNSRTNLRAAALRQTGSTRDHSTRGPARAQITRVLRDAAKIIDIEMLDHVVCGEAKADPHRRGFYSFREAGLL
jgi:hypothetical protein